MSGGAAWQGQGQGGLGGKEGQGGRRTLAISLGCWNGAAKACSRVSQACLGRIMALGSSGDLWTCAGAEKFGIWTGFDGGGGQWAAVRAQGEPGTLHCNVTMIGAGAPHSELLAAKLLLSLSSFECRRACCSPLAAVCCFACSLHKVRDDDGKPFEIEASWICDESNREHQRVRPGCGTWPLRDCLVYVPLMWAVRRA